MGILERFVDAAALPVWVLMLVYFTQMAKGWKEWMFIITLVVAIAVDGYETYSWIRG